MGAQEFLPVVAAEPSIFGNLKRFEDAQRIGAMLAKSTLVPNHFRESVSNCVIALELAERMQTNVLMVMQHLAVVNGKPGWDAQFITAKINTCGRFKPLSYDVGGAGDEYGCTAWTTEIGSERKLEGPKVTWKMVRAEKWDAKDGSKWKTMPDVMFGYRAASLFGKRHCPELLLGMQTREELEDMAPLPTVKDMGNAEVVRDVPVNDIAAALDSADHPEVSLPTTKRNSAEPSTATSKTPTSPGTDTNAVREGQYDRSSAANSAGPKASVTADAKGLATAPATSQSQPGANQPAGESEQFIEARLFEAADNATTVARLDELDQEARSRLAGEPLQHVIENIALCRAEIKSRGKPPTKATGPAPGLFED